MCSLQLLRGEWVPPDEPAPSPSPPWEVPHQPPDEIPPRTPTEMPPPPPETPAPPPKETSIRLLQEAQVTVTPGSAFGPSGEHHVRMAYCVDDAVIDTAFDRIEQRFPA